MTKQELFNRIVTHLRMQGKPAVDGGGACEYRTEDGAMCAVGVLIATDCYNKEFEGVLLCRSEAEADRRQGLLLDALEHSGVPTDEETLNFLSDAQAVHDSWRENTPFPKARFAMLGERHELDLSVLN